MEQKAAYLGENGIIKSAYHKKTPFILMKHVLKE